MLDVRCIGTHPHWFIWNGGDLADESICLSNLGWVEFFFRFDFDLRFLHLDLFSHVQMYPPQNWIRVIDWFTHGIAVDLLADHKCHTGIQLLKHQHHLQIISVQITNGIWWFHQLDRAFSGNFETWTWKKIMSLHLGRTHGYPQPGQSLSRNPRHSSIWANLACGDMRSTIKMSSQ